MLKILTKKLARQLGFEIDRSNLRTSEYVLIKHLLNYHKIDLVFDVGANCGQYAKFIRECGYTRKIVSFEPLSSAYAQLLVASQKDPLWKIAPQTAIGDREDKITINIAGNSQSSSVLPMLDTHLKAAPTSAYYSSEIVALNRLDTIAKNYITGETRSIFLKIDVQGFEKPVLEGATQIIPLVTGIQLELSLVPLYQDQPLFEEMLEFMKKIGYNLHTILPGFVDSETGRLLQMDGIFFKA